MKGSVKLGKIAGIAVFVHWTFLLLILFIVYVNNKSGQNVRQIMWSLLFILCVFIAVFLHELGHALVAKKYNIKTKDITLLPIGGLARLERIPEKPLEELMVAFAGPLVNITLALLTFFFISLPENPEVIANELSKGINSGNFFLNFYIVNIWLAVFNLIPAFPMDGGRILRAILSFKLKRHIATKIAARIGQIIAIGFVVLGFIINPFLIFIGLFIIVGAQMEAEHAASKFLLKGFKVRDILMKNYQTIDVNETIEKAVELLLNSQNKNFLVTEKNEPIGTLNRDEIIMALSKNDENKTVYSAMNKNLIYLDVDTLIENIFESVYNNKSNLMLVMENNQLIGTLDTENLLEFILIKEVKAKRSNAE